MLCLYELLILSQCVQRMSLNREHKIDVCTISSPVLIHNAYIVVTLFSFVYVFKKVVKKLFAIFCKNAVAESV